MSDPLHSPLDHACTLCPISGGVRSVCIGGRGAVEDVRLVVFGEAPAAEEDREGSFFVGPAGRLLEQLMDKAGIDRAKVRLENVVRCSSLDERGHVVTPSPPSVTQCLSYSFRILSQLLRQNPTRPPLVVALGNTAFEAFTGKRGITRNSGSLFPMVAPDPWTTLAVRFQVVGVVHPSSLLRNPTHTQKDEDKIVNDLRFAWATANGVVGDEYWKDYRWMDSVAEFAGWVDARIAEDAIVAYDLETNSLDLLFHPDGRIVSINLCHRPGQAVVIPVWHRDSPWVDDPVVQGVVLGHLLRLVAHCRIATWGGKYDINSLRLRVGRFDSEAGWEPAGFPFNLYIDGQDSARFLYGPKEKSYELDDWASEKLGFRGHGRGLDKADLFNAPRELLLRYAGGDSDATLQFSLDMYAKLHQYNLWDPYKRLLLDAVEDVVSMEIAGVRVSREMSEYLLAEYPRQMVPIVEEVKRSPWGQETVKILRERTGTDKDGTVKARPLEFNLGSPVTVQTLLFQCMQMPVNPDKVGKTGPSADKDVLEELGEYCLDKGLAAQGRVLDSLGRWRSMKDEYTRYVVPLASQADPAGFYHPSYKMTGVATGRFSSPFHGFPKESQVKLQFISRWMGGGGVLIFADYSAAEMRVMASLSNETNLIEALNSKIKIHDANAMRMYKLTSPKEVTDKMYNVAKRCGFGISMKIGAKKLALQLGCSEAEAQSHIDRWLSTFPRMPEWQRGQWEFARKHGFVHTVFGRVLWIEGIENSKFGDKATRESGSYPIQSPASDCTRLALSECIRELREQGCRSRFFSFIHDSIGADAAPGEWFTVAHLIRSKMEDWTREQNPWLKVPMKTDMKICAGSWGTPCSLEFTDDPNVLRISGPVRHVDRLVMEAEALGGITILSDELAGDDRKKRTVDFSLSPPGGSADHRNNYKAVLF